MRNSNTSRDGGPKLLESSKWLLAVLSFACITVPASLWGSDGARSPYIRDHWGAEQGFPDGAVYAIAQTPDGYLWIGGEKGLIRFDGFTFRLFQHSDSVTSPGSPVLGLAVDTEGNLWVRMGGQRVLRYRDGVFQDALPAAKSPQDDVTAMNAGKDGDILLSALVTGTVRFSQGRFETLASRPEISNPIISLAETDDSKVWMGTREVGLYCLSDGRVTAMNKGLPDKKINALLAVDGGELWVSTDNGVVRWNGTEFTKAGVPQAVEHIQGLVMIRDHDSNVWVGTSGGLIRIDARGDSFLEQGDNRSIGAVTAMFEDREGNVWAGTTQGIERLRHSVFTSYSVPGGLPSGSSGPLYVDSEGRTWFAPSEGGLYWLKEGQVGRVTQAGLDRDVVYSIAGAKGELWIGRRGGLTHLRFTGNSFTTETYTEAKGLTQDSVYAVHQARDGTVWAGTLSGGLSSFKDGGFKTYTTRNGLGGNSIASILESSDGTMWFGTPNGLSALSNGQWRMYTSRDGLPPGTVNCLLEDSAGTLWIGTANGLAFFRSGSIQTSREVPEVLREQILGMQEDKTGSLWIATASHILRVDREKMLSNGLSDTDVREFGLADGLQGTEGVKRYRSVVADSLGRIWFSTNRGISFATPTRKVGTSAPAMVHVEGVSADGQRFHMGKQIHVPAPPQRITFSYAGISLTVPERVRFKYKLDGFDSTWSDPTATREAVYTNLGAGSYLFRVVASNSEGVWNSSESTLRLEIAPVFWQTWWFRLSSVLALGLAVLLFFRLRVRRLTQQMNMRFEERLAERTRIAQELHDTLLQGFLSASMQLHVADDHIAENSPAKPSVGRVLELMGRVIDEGRNAVRGLRMPKKEFEDLEQAFAGIQLELDVARKTDYRVVAEGLPRKLRPVIREEVYRIGREAVVNAFRHSSANNVEVELEYAHGYLRLLVRDNGIGIDPQVVQAGRDGHWGLSGMRERAERIGARFRVLSGASAGTEIELSVPGSIAFEFPPADNRWGWLSKLKLRMAREEEPKVQSEKKK